MDKIVEYGLIGVGILGAGYLINEYLNKSGSGSSIMPPASIIGSSGGSNTSGSSKQPQIVNQGNGGSGSSGNYSGDIFGAAAQTYTNTSNQAMSITGSGQTLNPGSSLVQLPGSAPVIETPAGYNNAYYTTSLNTTAYGTPTGAVTAVTGGTYQGSPTVLGSTSGMSVQSTSNGFYKVTTSNGSVVYTKINPNG